MSIVYVVGLGPGAGEQMTAQARQALEQCSVIAGYTVYIDLIREEFPEKQFLMTPMRKEAERCKMALEQAQQGQDVAMVCSGDAGVYGMAGLMYELKADYPGVELKIVPGLSLIHIFWEPGSAIMSTSLWRACPLRLPPRGM